MRCAILLLVGGLVYAQTTPPLSRFYAVIQNDQTIGDRNYHIIEAKQDGNDTVVRDILVISVSACYPHSIVKAKSKRLANTPVAALVGEIDLCSVDSVELKREARRSRKEHKPRCEYSTAGVVASCGPRDVVLRSPSPLPVPFRTIPELLGEVEKRAFGAGPIFDFAGDMARFPVIEGDPVTEDEIAGSTLLPELRSGAFDRALWEPPRKKRCPGEGMNEALSGYLTPEKRRNPSITWALKPERELASWRSPIYPPLARQARIVGAVEVEIHVDASTGAVKQAEALSGHPLLKPVVLETVKNWQFKPGQSLEATDLVHATFRFRIVNCEAIVLE